MEDMTLHGGNGRGKWTGAYEREQKIRQKLGESTHIKNKEQTGVNTEQCERLSTVQRNTKLHTRNINFRF